MSWNQRYFRGRLCLTCASAENTPTHTAQISSQSLIPTLLSIEFKDGTVHLPAWRGHGGPIFVSTIEVQQYLGVRLEISQASEWFGLEFIPAEMINYDLQLTQPAFQCFVFWVHARSPKITLQSQGNWGLANSRAKSCSWLFVNRSIVCRRGCLSSATLTTYHRLALVRCRIPHHKGRSRTC